MTPFITSPSAARGLDDEYSSNSARNACDSSLLSASSANCAGTSSREKSISLMKNPKSTPWMYMPISMVPSTNGVVFPDDSSGSNESVLAQAENSSRVMKRKRDRYFFVARENGYMKNLLLNDCTKRPKNTYSSTEWQSLKTRK